MTLLVGWRKSNRPVKTEWWGGSVVICLQQGSNDLHMVHHHLLLQQSPEWFIILVPAYPGCPGKRCALLHTRMHTSMKGCFVAGKGHGKGRRRKGKRKKREQTDLHKQKNELHCKDFLGRKLIFGLLHHKLLYKLQKADITANYKLYTQTCTA